MSEHSEALLELANRIEEANSNPIAIAPQAATALRRQHDEIEQLKAERDAYKRACEVLFTDDSGDLDYIKYYITKNVLSIEARNAIDAARGKT